VRSVGALLTVLVLAAMLAIAMRQRRDGMGERRSAALFAALPLTLLSALAVIWTTVPLFLLPACAADGV
jgi:hypothetical protein